jgi:hypothetical protein
MESGRCVAWMAYATIWVSLGTIGCKFDIHRTFCPGRSFCSSMHRTLWYMAPRFKRCFSFSRCLSTTYSADASSSSSNHTSSTPCAKEPATPLVSHLRQMIEVSALWAPWNHSAYSLSTCPPFCFCLILQLNVDGRPTHSSKLHAVMPHALDAWVLLSGRRLWRARRFRHWTRDKPNDGRGNDGRFLDL